MKKPVSVVLSAFGMSGAVFHKPLLDAHPDFDLVGVVRRNPLKQVPELEHIPTFNTLEEAVNEARPELVVVNTPPALHKAEVILGLEAGCHILVEKPFALSKAEADYLLDLAAEKCKIVTAFQNRRWDSDFKTLMRVLGGSELGKVSHAEFFFNRFRPEVETHSWKEHPEHFGTGAVWNLGPHLLDQALFAFGMPESLSAFIRCVRPNARVEDFFSIHLHYPERQVDLKASYLVPDFRLKHRVQGTNYTYEKWGMDVQEMQLKAGISPFDPNFGMEPKDQKAVYKRVEQASGQLIEQQVSIEKGNYLDFYSQLFQAIRFGEPPPVKPDEMLQVAQLLEAVYQSAREGRRIKF